MTEAKSNPRRASSRIQQLMDMPRPKPCFTPLPRQTNTAFDTLLRNHRRALRENGNPDVVRRTLEEVQLLEQQSRESELQSRDSAIGDDQVEPEEDAYGDSEEEDLEDMDLDVEIDSEAEMNQGFLDQWNNRRKNKKKGKRLTSSVVVQEWDEFWSLDQPSAIGLLPKLDIDTGGDVFMESLVEAVKADGEYMGRLCASWNQLTHVQTILGWK